MRTPLNTLLGSMGLVPDQSLRNAFDAMRNPSAAAHELAEYICGRYPGGHRPADLLKERYPVLASRLN